MDRWHAQPRDDGCYDVYDDRGNLICRPAGEDGARAHHVAMCEQVAKLRNKVERLRAALQQICGCMEGVGRCQAIASEALGIEGVTTRRRYSEAAEAAKGENDGE